MEPKAAITVANTSPVKVVRHDKNDSVQTRSSSGVMRVVQSASAGANEIAEDLDETVVNVDDESFHDAVAFSFSNNDSVDDNAAWRFSTNFVTPPFKREQKSKAMRPQAEDVSTVVKKKSRRGEIRRQEDNQPVSDLVDLPLLSEVTSETTAESELTSSYSELVTIMQSVTNQLGQMSVTGASEQVKQTKKKKKQKKGQKIIYSTRVSI